MRLKDLIKLADSGAKNKKVLEAVMASVPGQDAETVFCVTKGKEPLDLQVLVGQASSALQAHGNINILGRKLPSKVKK